MKIILIGCGRTGAGLALVLDTAGHAVTVVDSDEAAFRRLGPAFSGTSISGVGFDRGRAPASRHRRRRRRRRGHGER